MANHGRQGESFQTYRARKARAHVVPGVYVADGAASKPQVLTRNAHLRKLALRGSRSGSRKGKAGASDPVGASAKAARSGGITHYRPFRCQGRA